MLETLKKIIANRTDFKPAAAAPANQTHIAACVLLLETAHIDDDSSREEMAHLVQTIRTKFALTAENAEELLTIAEKSRREAVDLWQFTDYLNRHCSMDEKTAIMEDIWRIIHIDGRLDRHEDHFSHKMANLLRLTHSQLIDAKLNARRQLEG